jgi:hypothetical protein
MEIRSRHLLSLVTLLLLLPGALLATPRPRSYGVNSFGVRLGWVGAPNGVSFRRTFGDGQSFEILAGYSPKYGRHAEIPETRKGNSFIGISYQPQFTMSDGGAVAVGLYADLGARLNYHHYRYISNPAAGPKISPDVTAGIGMMLDFNESVQIFADMKVKYYNSPGNFYAPGVESGAGIRFTL